MRALLYKIAKTPFFGRFMVKWENPLPPVKRTEWNSFSVKSRSGGVLRGLWSETSEAKSLGTIVLGHPMGKEAKGYFLKNGYT
jgi:hypothetical protein